MIPYTSCMCFNAQRDRGTSWKLVAAQKGTSLAVDEDHAFCIQIGGEDNAEDEPKKMHSALTTSEECILNALLRPGRGTMLGSGAEEVRAGRMSRQPVITNLVHLHLLDGAYAGIANMLLSKCDNWSFNTFNLDVSTGGRSLSYLLVHLFHEYGFVTHFRLDVVKVWHCFSLMEAAYHRHNPYHNSVHAADVTQAMHCFLKENKFSSHLTPLEAMSSVIAAVAHDLDHPGVTQAFLVATSNHLVNLYHNSSVLENHHWRTAISCLKESGIFEHLDKKDWVNIQQHIKSLILATDITRQKEFLTKFKNYLQTETLDMEQSQYRHFALQIALKCADLCNPCRPWPISQRWSYQVCQEFYRQGAYERELRLPLTPTFDCSRTKVAKIQADFFQFVVSPLFETWDHFLQTPLSAKLLRNLRHNYCQWQCRMEAVQRAEGLLKDEIPPQIQVDEPAVSVENVRSASEEPKAHSEQLLTIDTADVVLKQHRSRSDSGLSPRLLSPKIHMDTYSTEELHPSTTLLSLSSITNTVQLRQVYATTKVESHLICPNTFQSVKRPDSFGSNDQSALPNEDKSQIAQSPASSCPDGCCTPLDVPGSCPGTPESLVDGADPSTPHCQVSSRRRASDFCWRSSDGKPPVSRCKSQTLISLPSYPFSTPSSGEPCAGTSQQGDNARRLSTSSVMAQRRLLSEGNPATSFETDQSSNSPQSWCWHISRSFSAERPQRPSQDFDCLGPSLPATVSQGYPGYAGRRASAPMAVNFSTDVGVSHSSGLGDIDTKGGLRGGSEEDCNPGGGRRWSIPMETLTGSNLGRPTSTTNIPESHSITDEAIRRHSFGHFDPLFAMSALESEDPSCNLFDDPDDPPDLETVSNCDAPLPLFSPTHSANVPRRGSLPVEVPIALMCHTSSPSRHRAKPKKPERCSPPPGAEATRSPFHTPGHVFEPSTRHGSPTDLLSVLIGPAGMLNTMHGMTSNRPAVVVDNSRRRSGGLEMLSGLWRSRNNEAPVGVGIKLQRQLMEDWRKGQQRRGSVPLISLSSGNTCSGDQGD